MLTPAHMALTNGAKFLHCLPVRRNVEVSDAVLDVPGYRSPHQFERDLKLNLF